MDQQLGHRGALGSIVLGLLITVSAFGTTMVITQPPLPSKPNNEIQLTFGTGAHSEPRFSPNGMFVAYSSNESGSYSIWTMAADGRKQTRVTSMPGDQLMPSWSPDGTRIAFLWKHDAFSDLCVTTLKEDDQECLTSEARVQNFAWSPNDSALAYDAGNGTIRILNLTSGVDTSFPFRGHISDPAFGPASSTLYFSLRTTKGDYIWNASIDGNNGRQLSWEGSDVEPQVSPTGIYLMYLTNLTGRYEPWLVDLFTGENTYLFNRPDLTPAYTFPNAPLLASGTIPSWGPKGSSMLFISSENGTEGNLYLVTLNVPVDLNQANPPSPSGFVRTIYDLNVYNRVPVPGLISDAQWSHSGNVVIQANVSGFEQLLVLQNGPPVKVGYGG